jgi:hypothetical protein
MIDLSLNSILIPDITGYTPPFGTKIIRTETNQGGLSTREVNNNVLTPFLKMRNIYGNDNTPFVITQSENTSKVEYDVKLIIDAEDVINLSLNNATYIGCRVVLINKSDDIQNLLCSSVSQTADKLLPHSEVQLIWNGTAWRNISAPGIGKIVVQYPTEKAPDVIYPCTQWEAVNYNGAFFRTYSAGVSGQFVEEGQTLPSPQPNKTDNSPLSISWDADQNVSSKDPAWSVSYSGDSHSHTFDYWWEQHGSTNEYRSTQGEKFEYGPNKNISDRTIEISGTVSGDHDHYFTPSGTISSLDKETRPKNYTVKLWKRIA